MFMAKYFFIIASLLLGSCASPPPPKQSGTPPLELPVNLSLGKQVITFHTEITEAEVKKEWTVAMEFYPYPLRTWEEYRKNPPSPDEDKLLLKKLGFINNIDHGVPANFKVIIYDIEKKATLLNTEVNYPGSFSRGYGRYIDLITTKLDKGKYDISLEYTPYSGDLSSIAAKAVLMSIYHK